MPKMKRQHQSLPPNERREHKQRYLVLPSARLNAVVSAGQLSSVTMATVTRLIGQLGSHNRRTERA
jgi:hypothetical protein